MTPPVFATNYPSHPALRELVRAFQAGDYAYVRSQAQAWQQDREAPTDVTNAMRDLVRRTEPDPLALWLFGGAGFLLAVLAAWAFSKGSLFLFTPSEAASLVVVASPLPRHLSPASPRNVSAI